MKSLILIVLLGATSFAQEVCNDPFNPFSKVELNVEQRVVASCRYLTCEVLAAIGENLEGKVEMCSSSHELVLKKIFEGNYNKMVEWWKLNKEPDAYNALCSNILLEVETWMFYLPTLSKCE